MNTIGIIGAMDSEVEHLQSLMDDRHEQSIAGRLFYAGTIYGKQAVIVKSGIGKVAAAITAQLLIDRFAADALINTGVAGGLDSRLAVRDLVISTAAVQHDFNLTAFGHVRGFLYGEDDRKPTEFRADPTLVARAQIAAERVLTGGSKAITGIIASGDIFVNDTAVKQMLIRSFHAAAAEMEGAAIAQTAVSNGVPFVIIRTISDLAEHQANVSFDVLERYAGELAGMIVAEMLQDN